MRWSRTRCRLVPDASGVLEALPQRYGTQRPIRTNRAACEHGWLRARLRPTRLKQDSNAKAMLSWHAFMQNARRSHRRLVAGQPANRQGPSRSTGWPQRKGSPVATWSAPPSPPSPPPSASRRQRHRRPMPAWLGVVLGLLGLFSLVHVVFTPPWKPSTSLPCPGVTSTRAWA